MADRYLERQIAGRIVGPIVAFREYISRDVLPAFSNIEARARQIRKDYYNRIGSQPAGEYEYFDMADVAEAAQDHASDWYNMMTSLRQSMLNLMAAGLFHLIEQQLGALTRDACFRHIPLRDTNLDVVARWYLTNLGVDLKTLFSWERINELRLVANAVKHAEGSATSQLKVLRPELFTDPAYAAMFPGVDGPMVPVSAPLAGEDFFVTEEILQEYAEVAESFFGEIAACFRDAG